VPGPARKILTLVVDRRATRHALATAVAAAVSGGVDRVQLRDRELEAADFLVWAHEIAAAARGARADVELIVNRRVDIALATACDGVHLGFDAMAVADARALLASTAQVGVSTHAEPEIRTAARAGADYVHLAPIFDPISKPAERPPLGVAVLEKLADLDIPVHAQGGLDAERARAAVAAGAAGVAVTGPILLADDPRQAARRLRSALDDA
jgi:thiamine-phosphate diphosphorylase